MGHTVISERVTHARAAAVAKNRRPGSPMARAVEKIEYARLLKTQGHSLGQIITKTGTPRSSLHRYLTDDIPTSAAATESTAQPLSTGRELSTDTLSQSPQRSILGE
jgi:DNA invertase Pin-like site-specific DNA recombinase